MTNSTLPRSTSLLSSILLIVLLLGCKDLAGTQTLPAGTSNPSTYNTPAGAFGMRNAAVAAFENELVPFISNTGALTDELTVPAQTDIIPGDINNNVLDQRILPEGQLGGIQTSYLTDYNFSGLNEIRGLANQAIGQLATYDTAAPPTMRGELYALEGFAEIMLADLFCSGVPLGTLNFQNDFTYRPSSTTVQVYTDAVAKFDSALALSGDSIQIVDLASVGKGRALLDLGQYAQAAQAVATVPLTFQYQDTVIWVNSQQIEAVDGGLFLFAGTFGIANQEGENGLPFLSSHDPRSAGYLISINNEDFINPYFPVKYQSAQSSPFTAPITIADGIEARLIQAEAAWHGVATGQGSWLDQLNALRATAIVPGMGQPEPQLLPRLAMPSTDTGQVSLLFQERAEWLFVTGHRQGDLRRLIRNYGRNESQVYPTGVYQLGGQYGSDVTAPIPTAEYTNPDFHGCIDRNA